MVHPGFIPTDYVYVNPAGGVTHDGLLPKLLTQFNYFGKKKNNEQWLLSNIPKVRNSY